jgi:cyanoexosortase A
MRTINYSFLKPLSDQFWLLTLAGSLIAVNLSLQMKLTGDFISLSFSLLLWGVVLSQLWEKRHNLSLRSGVFSTFLGLVLIAFVLIRSLLTARVSLLFAFSPVISALGLILIASGFRGFKQYTQELLLILVLSVPESFVSQLFDPSSLTGSFATYMLSHLGFKASFQGINIVMNTGSVQVLQQCSGLVNMLLLWQLAMFFIISFPTNLAKKIFVPVVGVIVGFIVNAVRVAILTVLITNSHEEAFHYWHDGNGAQIFVLMSVVVFGVFCYFLLEQDEPGNHEPMEFPDT